MNIYEINLHTLDKGKAWNSATREPLYANCLITKVCLTGKP